MRKNVPYNIENPSSEELLAFFKGSMDISDTKKMEQGMENDPLLADALSGLREMKSPEKLLSIQQSLQTKISEQLIENKAVVKQQPKKVWQFSPTYYAAAASIVLILGFSFFFYKQTQDAKTLFNENYQPAIVTPEMTDIYTPETQKDTTIAKITGEDIHSGGVDKAKEEVKIVEKTAVEAQKIQENPIASVNEAPQKGSGKSEMKDFSPQIKSSDEADKEELKKKWEKATQPIVSSEVNKPMPVPAPAPMPAKEPSYYNYNKTITVKPTSPFPAPPSANNANNTNIPSLSQSKEKEQIAMAESKKNSSPKEKYLPKAKKERVKAEEQKADVATAESEDFLAEDIKAEKENDEVNDIYLSGISKYEAKDYAGAVAEFKKIPKNHSYRTNADYFSANCYLSLNKQQEAIHLLKPLAEKANWNYQADAKWYLGMAYLANGQKKKAEEVLLKLLEEGGGTRKAEIERILKEMGVTTK
jgi:tetratricopeptide (TPR) repeat protein